MKWYGAQMRDVSTGKTDKKRVFGRNLQFLL